MNFQEIKEKIKKWFYLMPSGTKITFCMILSFYILKLFWITEENDTCLNPKAIWGNIIFSLPRLVLHTFVHANILHLLFNSIALIHLCSSFEKHVGTVLLLYLVLIFSILIGIIYSVVAKIFSVLSLTSWMSSCTVGISGVLFSVIVIESLQNETIKQFYGVDIPSKYNHWILLIVCQIIWPRASFLGHLSGIIVGYLYQGDCLNFLMLSHNTIYNIEQKLPLNLSSFVVHNGGATLPIFNNQGTTGDQDYRRLNADEYDDIFPDDDDDIPAERLFEDDHPTVETPLVNGLINDQSPTNSQPEQNQNN